MSPRPSHPVRPPMGVPSPSRRGRLTSAGCRLATSPVDLITASALLDILTKEELSALITVSVGAGCLVLLTLSVVGRVELTPAEPLDRRIAAAFDAHQRRVTERGRLLGPDAVAVAVEQAARLGSDVLVRPSPWQLGAAGGRTGGGVVHGMGGCCLRQE